MKLDELIEKIEEINDNRSLSDEYLKQNGFTTREEYGIGEYSYGIVTIPVDWVLPYFSVIKKIIEVDTNFCSECCAKDKCNGMCCFEQIKEMFEGAENE